MSQKNVRNASRRAGFIGAATLAAAALILAPAAFAQRGGGGHGGGGGGHSGGGGGHSGGGGGQAGGGGGRASGGGGGAVSRGGGPTGPSGGGYRAPSGGGSRGSTGGGSWRGYSGGGARSGGVARGGGWTNHSGGTHYSASPGMRYAAHPGRPGGGPPGGGRPGGGHPGPGYGHGGWGHYGHYYPYWGWNYWGWGWGWGWAPYWSSWWWGGWWGWPGFYVSVGVPEGSVDTSVRRGRYAMVKTDVTPEEAEVWLDGKYIGAADDFDGIPDYLYLGPGKYHLEFKLQNYLTFATDLDVKRGDQIRIAEQLKLEPGKSALDAFSPPSKGTPLGRVFTKGGGATSDAAPQGDDGWSDSQRPAPRGGDDGFSDPIPAPSRGSASDERTDLRIAAPANPASRGRIRFRVTPDDAAVYMDDRYLGAADDLAANPRGVAADAGTHTVTVTRPGYKPKTVEITAKAGTGVDVVVDLEK